MLLSMDCNSSMGTSSVCASFVLFWGLGRSRGATLSKVLFSDVQVALKLLNCWESIAGANRDVIRPYVNALLPHVVGNNASLRLSSSS